MKFLKGFTRYFTLLSLLIIGGLVYLVFFHENSYGHMKELSKEVRDLREEIRLANDTMEYYREQNRLLDVSAEEMERIARERYFMQGPDEDVYIVEDARK